MHFKSQNKRHFDLRSNRLKTKYIQDRIKPILQHKLETGNGTFVLYIHRIRKIKDFENVNNIYKIIVFECGLTSFPDIGQFE